MRFGNAKVISFISGKGGVGKTSLLSETAVILSQQGKKVLIIDGDMGLANVDVLFGARVKGHLAQVIFESRSLSEILTPLNSRIDLISSGSGIRSLNQLSLLERQGLMMSLFDLQYKYDYILIDTRSGLSEYSLQLASLSDLIVTVMTPDPASFTDAYAMIKVLNLDFRRDQFLIVSNMIESEESGHQLYKKFTDVSGRFLMLSLDYLGGLSFDQGVKKIIQMQKLPIKQVPEGVHYNQVSKIVDNLVHQSILLRGTSHFWTDLGGVA